MDVLTIIIISILTINTIMLIGLSLSLVKIMEYLKGEEPVEKNGTPVREKQLQDLDDRQLSYDQILVMNIDKET